MKNQKDEDIKILIRDKVLRTEMARRDHYFFFHFFLALRVKYKTADFQKEIFRITQDDNNKLSVITAFRGSAKSTIVTLSYPLWAILGIQQKKFVIIVSKTQNQAKLHLSNIKYELKSNKLLRSHLGPFEENEEWGVSSIIIPKYNAKIMAISSEQGIRGVLHRGHRPDLIIADDIEDLNSVKSKEKRDKTYEWFKGDILPLGTKETKKVIVGNLLHEDSLLKKIEKEIENKQLNGLYREYPILDKDNNIAWTGQFPDIASIDSLKLQQGSEIAWQREFMLKILPDEDQIIKPSWINFYNEIPYHGESHRYKIISIDPAFGDKNTNDYTAIVSAEVFDYKDKVKIYILPYPINKRVTSSEIVNNIKTLSQQCESQPKIIYENVGPQKMLGDLLESSGLNVEGFNPHGKDKRYRLNMTSKFFEENRIFFPQKGTEILIQQIIGFGVEKHDDLVDSLVMIILSVIRDNNHGYTVPPLENRKKEESVKELDRARILEKEYERSNFDRIMGKTLRDYRNR